MDFFEDGGEEVEVLFLVFAAREYYICCLDMLYLLLGYIIFEDGGEEVEVLFLVFAARGQCRM